MQYKDIIDKLIQKWIITEKGEEKYNSKELRRE